MRFTKEDTEGHLAHHTQHTHRLLQRRSAFAQCLPQACAKACESPKTPSKASDASEWSAPMACVGGTASAARLQRPKSSAQRGDGLEVAAIRILEELANLRLRRAFRFAGGRMLIARPDFGRCPQHWRPPGARGRRAQQRAETALGLRTLRTYALTKGLRPLFSKNRAPPLLLRSKSIGESLAYPPRLAVDLGSYVDGEAYGWARQPYGYFDPAPRSRDIIHTYSYVPTAPSGAPHERVKAR